MAGDKRFVLWVGIFGIFAVFALGAQRNDQLNHSRRGICVLEVPTQDLLTPQDRRGADLRGNSSRLGYSKIEVCCSGYARNPKNPYECDPICDGCENGNCIAPGWCECKQGYVRTNNGNYCVLHCTGGCGPGGICTATEHCTCDDGFVLDKLTKKCRCMDGYKLQKSTHICLPDCPKGCLNGECTAPNKCSCKPGWTLDSTGSKCNPHCSFTCLNGDCVAPDLCSCKKGYVSAPGMIHNEKCVAHCPGGCPNGVCSAPNFCICNPGYIKQAKGNNMCVRRYRRSIHYEVIPEQPDNLE